MTILVSYYGDTHRSDTYDTLEEAKEGARASCVADGLVAELSEPSLVSRAILGVVDSAGNFYAAPAENTDDWPRFTGLQI